MTGLGPMEEAREQLPRGGAGGDLAGADLGFQRGESFIQFHAFLFGRIALQNFNNDN